MSTASFDRATMGRIVRIITRLNIGGPSIQAITLSDRLDQDGFRTTLVHGRLGPREGDMSYLLPPGGMATAYLPALRRSINPLADMQAAWQIFRLLCRARPNIVHTHMAKAGALGRMAAIAYNRSVGRRSPARLVHTYHGHVFEGYFRDRSTSTFLAIERWLGRRTDAIVAISDRIRSDLLETYQVGRADQVVTIPLGFDLTQLAAIDAGDRQSARHELGLVASDSVVTTIGRLTPIKDHQSFLEMARQVAQRCPATVFLIVGDGELRPELEAMAAAWDLTGRVRFLGWRRDLATIYGASDVFVISSRNEGTPVALIEAMAAGVASVSTDVGGVRDVIRRPDEGLLVPAGAPSALADAVYLLLDSPDQRQQMAGWGRQSVLARFNLDRLLTDVAELYRDLVSTNGLRL
jgi:glycosyltransferase involved in cell wall biosynthesis